MGSIKNTLLVIIKEFAGWIIAILGSIALMFLIRFILSLFFDLIS